MNWGLVLLSNLCVLMTSAYDVSLGEFGNCHFHVKILGSEPGVEFHDLGAEVIRNNSDMGPWTFHDSSNSNDSYEMTNPSIKVKAPCTLHVIIVSLTASNNNITDLIWYNPYFESSPLHSRFIILLLEDLIFLPFTFSDNSVRARVFVKSLNPTEKMEKVPWLYFCPYCLSPKLRLVETDLASVTTLTFRNDWALRLIYIDDNAFAKSSCLAEQRSKIFTVTNCRRHFLLFQSILEAFNFTLTYKDGPFVESLDYNSVGYHYYAGVNTVFNPMEDPLYFVYCDEKLRWKGRMSVAVWFSPLSLSAWLGLLGSLVGVSIVSLDLNQPSLNIQNVLKSFFLTLRIIFRQDLLLGKLWLILSLSLFIVGSNYENYITSELTVPPADYVFNDIGELVKNGFKIAVTKTTGEASYNFTTFYDMYIEPLKRYGIQLNENHFVDIGPLGFTRLILEGGLITCPTAEELLRLMLTTLPSALGGRYNCWRAVEGTYSKNLIAAYIFISHITDFLQEFALRWNERGDFELSTSLSNHFAMSQQAARNRQWETFFSNRFGNQAWFKALNKPYLPLNLDSHENDFITFFQLTSFFVFCGSIILLISILFFIEMIY